MLILTVCEQTKTIIICFWFDTRKCIDASLTDFFKYYWF
jgi:hypothetical protein